MSDEKPGVGIIMGSRSDWPTLKAAADVLDALRVPYEARIVSAHRTPKRLYDYATSARDARVRTDAACMAGHTDVTPREAHGRCWDAGGER